MEKTTKHYTPKQLHKFSKHFTGYVLALVIVVWGLTFVVMNIWWMVGALLVAMLFGASLFMLTMTAGGVAHHSALPGE